MQRGDKCPKLQATERFNLLKDESDTTVTAIMRVQKENDIIKRQRLKTMKQSKSKEKMEELMETAKNSLKRVLSGSSRDKLFQAEYDHGKKRQRKGSFTKIFGSKRSCESLKKVCQDGVSHDSLDFTNRVKYFDRPLLDTTLSLKRVQSSDVRLKKSSSSSLSSKRNE